MVLVHKDQDDKQLVLDITAKVDGRQVPVEDLSTLTDLEKIKKVSHFMTHLCCTVPPWPVARLLFSQHLLHFKKWFGLPCHTIFCLRQLYKITPQEDRTGTLLDAVVCRMATKDVM